MSEPHDRSGYAAYASRLRQTGLVPDPWVGGEPRFRPEPLVLTAAEHARVCEAAEAVRRWVPETIRLDAMHPEQLAAERSDWVLKSDYGCEGQEVFIGRSCTPEAWEEVLRLAIPERWVAQRYFEAETDAAGDALNLGPYVIAGRAAGLYVRAQQGPTDYHARSVPVLVQPGDELPSSPAA